MNENEIARLVVNACFTVHKEIGPGLFESVYEELLCYELAHCNGLTLERQKILPVFYKGKKMEIGFRADLIIENKVILEIKSIEELGSVHYKQLLTYLRLTDLRLGLLVNFNEALIKDGIKRVVNHL